MSSLNKSEQFRSKGLNIIKNPKIVNMTDFLTGSSEYGGNTQKLPQSLHEKKEDDPSATYKKVRKPSFHDKQKENLGRLHIQIRQDLIEKLLDTVFNLKRNPNNRGASQRAVIEEALENYFKNE